jgi:two-component system OmpR family response regulator
MRILVAEDEERMARLLFRGLREEGYAVDLTASAEDALFMACETDYDAVILDVMLADGDGFSVCQKMRTERRWAPVLMLTARDAVSDRVTGLDVGADDYLTKPFAFEELLARLRAIIRRGQAPRPAELAVGPVVLDPGARRVEACGNEVRLTALEYAMLEVLMRHAGQVVSRTRIRAHVWDDTFEGDSNVVDVYIGYLRDKIDRPLGLSMIETVRGAGYRFRDDVPPTAD